MKELSPQQWGMMIGRKAVFCHDDYLDWQDDSYIDKINGVKLDFVLSTKKDEWILSRYCKPILRTLDQITEEEKAEFRELFCTRDFYDVEINNQRITYITKEAGTLERKSVYDQIRAIDWLRSQGFCLNPEWFEEGLAIKEGE